MKIRKIAALCAAFALLLGIVACATKTKGSASMAAPSVEGTTSAADLAEGGVH